MDSRGFQFKQFFVAHDLCAMKVGTDSIILGSWIARQWAETDLDLRHCVPNVLDIGAGSGLLTLMLAQAVADNHHKKAASSTDFALAMTMVAVEPEPNAFTQSCANFRVSPWASQIHAVNTTIQAFSPTSGSVARLPEKYEVIVSNPPYFPARRGAESSHPAHSNPLHNKKHDEGNYLDFSNDNGFQSHERRRARHQVDLNLDELLEQVLRFLSPTGHFYCILPDEQAQQLKLMARGTPLFFISELLITPNKHKQIKRVALKFGFESKNGSSEKLIIHGELGGYSDQFKALCRDYYLNF